MKPLSPSALSVHGQVKLYQMHSRREIFSPFGRANGSVRLLYLWLRTGIEVSERERGNADVKQIPIARARKEIAVLASCKAL